eukprot:UN18863
MDCEKPQTNEQATNLYRADIPFIVRDEASLSFDSNSELQLSLSVEYRTSFTYNQVSSQERTMI